MSFEAWVAGGFAGLSSAGLAWWLLPLSASLVSASLLAVSAAAGREARERMSSISARSYLVSGPALAIVNIIPLTPSGLTAPIWVGEIMLLLFFASAALYYATFSETER